MAALAELLRRAKGDLLSVDQATRIADDALAHQTGSATGWQLIWGGILEACRATGKLPDDRWASYARNCAGVILQTRAIIGVGDPVPVSLSLPAPRLGNANFVGLFDWGEIAIDGKTAAKPMRQDWASNYGHLGKLDFNYNGWGASYSVPQVDGHATAALPPGPHTLTANIMLLLYEPGKLPPAQKNGERPPADPKLALDTVDLTMSAPFTLVPKDQVPPLTAIDPALRDKVVAAVKVTGVERRGEKSIVIHWTFEDPPARLDFRVYVRPAGGKDVFVGQADGQINSSDGYTFGSTGPFGNVKTVDLIFRPDVDSLRRSTNPLPAWGEEVVLKDIPIKPAPTQTPASEP